MGDCIFCKIVAGVLPAERVYEDEAVLAFRDIAPLAPTHVLVVPKRHVETLNDIDEGSAYLVGRMHLAAKAVAEGEGISERGYRTVLNCNAEAGQVVFHLHLHVLGGRPLTWPPG
jgi:histidine triad (HIT) family protein